MKLVIFDLDGVLVKAKEIHFNALNDALASVDPKFCISYSEHLNIYDGLKTRDKLKLLTKNKGLSVADHDLVWERKQAITTKKVTEIEKDLEESETKRREAEREVRRLKRELEEKE